MYELAMFSCLSHKTFEHIVRTLNNSPVNIEYVRNANNIYGCDVPTLKGKQVR